MQLWAPINCKSLQGLFSLSCRESPIKGLQLTRKNVSNSFSIRNLIGKSYFFPVWIFEIIDSERARLDPKNLLFFLLPTQQKNPTKTFLCFSFSFPFLFRKKKIFGALGKVEREEREKWSIRHLWDLDISSYQSHFDVFTQWRSFCYFWKKMPRWRCFLLFSHFLFLEIGHSRQKPNPSIFFFLPLQLFHANISPLHRGTFEARQKGNKNRVRGQ